MPIPHFIIYTRNPCGVDVGRRDESPIRVSGAEADSGEPDN